MTRLICLLLLMGALQACDWFGKSPTPAPGDEPLPKFEGLPTLHPLVRGIVDEASGIVESRNFPGNFWIQEDGGNPAAVFLFTREGVLKKRIALPIENRDWEDIAIGNGPESGKTYLYLAETGDNAQVYNEYAIYRFLEPMDLDASPTQIDKIRFAYSDNKKYNAETLLLDPATKDLYVLTKGIFGEKIFMLKYPQSTTEVNKAEFMGPTQQFILTGGDISADGREIILKNYDNTLYWRRRKDESIVQCISRLRDINLPYAHEVQGEAVCFDKEGNYLTVSERADQDMDIPLYIYARKKL